MILSKDIWQDACLPFVLGSGQSMQPDVPNIACLTGIDFTIWPGTWKFMCNSGYMHKDERLLEHVAWSQLLVYSSPATPE